MYYVLKTILLGENKINRYAIVLSSINPQNNGGVKVLWLNVFNRNRLLPNIIHSLWLCLLHTYTVFIFSHSWNISQTIQQSIPFICNIWEYIVQYTWILDIYLFQYSIVNFLLHCLFVKKKNTHAIKKNGTLIQARQKMSFSCYFGSDLKCKVCVGHAFMIWCTLYRKKRLRNDFEILY